MTKALKTIRRDAETVHGLGNHKDALFLHLIRTDGVEAYEGSVRYLHAARDAQLKLAVVTSSRHCGEVLRAARIQAPACRPESRA